MNLKCRINEKEYDVVVQGTTFSDEYNETLDSGSIILDHIEEIKDLKPYDDVYIYENYEGEFPRSDSERRFYANLNVDENEFITETLFENKFIIYESSGGSNEGSVDSLYTEIENKNKNEEEQKLTFNTHIDFFNNENKKISSMTIVYKNCSFKIDGENKKTLFLESDEKPTITGYSTDLIYKIPGFGKESLSLEFNIDDGKHNIVWKAEIDGENELIKKDDYWYKISNTKIEDNDKKFLDNGQSLFERVWQKQEHQTKKESRENITIGIDNNFGLENGKIISGIRISDNFTFSVTITKNKENNENEKIKKVYTCFITKNNNNLITIQSEKCSSFILKGETLNIGNHYFVDNSITLVVEKEEVEKDKYKYIFFKETNTYENVEDYFTYSFEFEKIPFAINEQENTNNEQENTNKSFYKHLLLDTYFKERINVSPYLDNGKILYKYRLQLFSEAKRLETIQLPNISITQPVKFGNKKTKTVYHYIKQFVNMYSPKIKVAISNNQWKYFNKYYLDPKLEEIFGNVYSPNFSLNNPNLRDVLKNLMLVKDQIPIVIDDMISCLDVTKRNGTFEEKGILSVVSSLNSENYCDSLKRTYNNALSQENTCKSIEFLNFRNSDTALMTLDNMRLETRFPIYKINKMYMCYFKQCEIGTIGEDGFIDEKLTEKQFYLCQQDITPLVKLNSERQLLKKDWNEFENDVIPLTIEELSQYRMATIGYDIGSKYITGWGEKYNYIKNDLTWFKYDKTYIQNILTIVDELNPYGDKEYYMVSNDVTKVFMPGKILFDAENQDGNSVFRDIFGLEQKNNDFVNLFSNMSSGLKGLFFKIEYEGFYNGTVVHSKNNGYSDITINDNSSASLTLLEKDGLFQKEKINRFSNEQVTIQARYTDINDVQPLGSVYSDDIIVYHREYSVFDNVVLATYYGTKDYVLKNYFTTVFAKHRPYNLLPYEESVTRAENKKMFLNFSKNKLLYEKNKTFNFDINNVLNFFRANTNENIKFTNELMKKNEQINAGYIKINGEKYASDVNTFVSGNSLCLNMAMYDNVSGGVYIKEKEPDISLLNDDVQKDFTGSVQDWYITVDDVETGSLKNIGFYFSHNENNLSIENPDDDYIRYNFYEQIFKLPKITNQNNEETNLINGEFEINKDNKELIDMTFQVEPISNTNDVFFSQWMMKLSNLLGVYKKVDSDISLYDPILLKQRVNVLTTSVGYNRGYSIYNNSYEDYKFPFIMLKMKKNVFEKINNKTTINFQLFYEKNGPLYSGPSFPYIYKYNVVLKNIVEIRDDGIFVRVVENIEYVGKDNDVHKVQNERNIFFKKEKTFCNIDFSQQYGDDNLFFINVDFFLDEANKTTFKYKNDETMMKNLFYINEEECSVNVLHNSEKNISAYQLIKDGATKENLKKFENFDIYLNTLQDKTIPTETIKKNMFIVLSDKPMKEHLVYDEYEDISEVSGYVRTDYKVGDIISLNGISKNDNSGPYIKVNLNGISGTDYQSVQMWYYVDGSYKFVFGVNVTEEDKDNGEIKIYVSTISNKDPRVFDSNGLLVGEVVNYLEEDINYGVDQYFKKK